MFGKIFVAPAFAIYVLLSPVRGLTITFRRVLRDTLTIFGNLPQPETPVRIPT